MDKLVKYLEFRFKKYGKIDIRCSKSSMYYTIGDFTVRISDHMKYGSTNVSKVDFYFIIQPNDTYIFIKSPRFNNEGKMFMKIIAYNEAKEFVKKLHEYSIINNSLSDVYAPSTWNGLMSNDFVMVDGKMDWSEFKKKYIDNKSNDEIRRVYDRIEVIQLGKMTKGKVSEKEDRIKESYEKLTRSMYETLLKKI